MITLGIDLGSSFVKAAIFNTGTGRCTSVAQYPDQEMTITAKFPGWAEQSPAMWWESVRAAVKAAVASHDRTLGAIGAIGITYQMHGLVCLDRQGEPLRDAIIWCDSRAVRTGEFLAGQLGHDYCRRNLLNDPGNFTASKLRWVMDHEPALYARIGKIMLPGDYIAYCMTNEICTTNSGLSEGIFWDFKDDRISAELLSAANIPVELTARVVPTFGEQGRLSAGVAHDLGLTAGIPVAYRAGDQPNNAFSLNVLEPGEIAATAGTSGVVYGVTERKFSDPESRINTFLHVNHTARHTRIGHLLCINGTGSLYSWLRRNIAADVSYEQMDNMAGGISAGTEGLFVLPFGNGAERVLKNSSPGCSFHGLDFNRHGQAHLFRAAMEGIALTFKYGIDIMTGIGIEPSVVRAGNANMFRSRQFRQILADVCNITIELYETDGSVGAAMGAAVGAGYYSDPEQAFAGIRKLNITEPSQDQQVYQDHFIRWKNLLDQKI